MNIRQFHVRRAVGLVVVILVAGIFTGGYLIWHDGSNTGIFLLSVAS